MARTAGEVASWGAIAALAAVAALHPAGCAPADADPLGDVAAGMLADFGPNVVVPTLAAFHDAAGSLAAAVAAWEQAPEDPTALAAARDAWWAAMDVWQEAELLQIGPAAPSSEPGGEDLRDAIYSWPTVNPCRVDQETVDGAWSEPGYASELLVNARGLDAVEHLLWGGADNACPAQVDINADGTWDAMTDAERAAARAGLAGALADEVVVDASRLLQAWDPAGGDLATRLGTGAGPFPTRTAAVQAVYDAVFYLDLVTKDCKLAGPLGLRGDGGDRCPGDPESLPSGTSHDWIVANLRGFRSAITGGDGEGLVDLLAALGHEAVGAALVADVDAAIAVAQTLDRPVDVALVDDRDAVVAVYDAVEAVTDRLRGDVVTVLGLRMPTEAAGDND